MLFDTHCHLTMDPLYKNMDEVLSLAVSNGVQYFVVPGVDFASSEKASEITLMHKGVYAAIGIHPEIVTDEKIIDVDLEVKKIEQLLGNKKIVAIGEVGLDRHVYTHYLKLEDEDKISLLMSTQKDLLKKQVQLAVSYELSLILHSRDTAPDMIDVLQEVWNEKLVHKTVLHCCEADEKLLFFAKEKGIFIGVDGDISWSKKKQRFIKEVPLELLVLETDSPYLTPEPIKSVQKFPNEPKNVVYVRDVVAEVKGISVEEVEEATTQNAKRLFKLEM